MVKDNYDVLSRDIRFKKHKKRLRNVQSRIDVKPPRMFTNTYLRVKEVRDDHKALRRIMIANVDLLLRINRLQLHNGFTSNRNRFIHQPPSKVRLSNTNLAKIENENFFIAKRLLSIKPSVNTYKDPKEHHDVKRRTVKYSYRVSEVTFEKYRNYVFPEDIAILRNLLRPKVYFDLEVENIRPLGRIFIQLFTEACPELILQFVRMCAHNSCGAFHFIRIFPTLWIEGEIAVHEDSKLNTSNFDYDMNVLDHSLGAGILSFAKYYLMGFPQGLVNFSISFKPLTVLNGERIPFGLVTRGFRLLDCLQDYGTKNGKTKKDIVIVNCGLISWN